MGVLQLKRGTTKPALAEGEPFFNTLKKMLHIGDDLRIGHETIVNVYPGDDIKAIYDSITDQSENKVYTFVINGGKYLLGDNSIQFKNYINWEAIGLPTISNTQSGGVATDGGEEVHINFSGKVRFESTSTDPYVNIIDTSTINGLVLRLVLNLSYAKQTLDGSTKIKYNDVLPKDATFTRSAENNDSYSLDFINTFPSRRRARSVVNISNAHDGGILGDTAYLENGTGNVCVRTYIDGSVINVAVVKLVDNDGDYIIPVDARLRVEVLWDYGVRPWM